MLGMNGLQTAATIWFILGTIAALGIHLVDGIVAVRTARWAAVDAQERRRREQEQGYLDSLGGPSVPPADEPYDRKRDTADGR